MKKKERNQIKSRRIPCPLPVFSESSDERIDQPHCLPLRWSCCPLLLTPAVCSDRLLQMPPPVVPHHSLVRTTSRVALEQWSGPTRAAGACLSTRLYARLTPAAGTTGEDALLSALPPSSHDSTCLLRQAASSSASLLFPTSVYLNVCGNILLTLYLSTNQDYLLFIWRPGDEHMARSGTKSSADTLLHHSHVEVVGGG